MGLIDLIEKTINEHGSAAIKEERLKLVREEAQALEKRVAALEKENGALRRRIAQLEAQVAAQTVREEFVECQGALFKRKPGGGYHLAVYCPRCKGPMVSLMDDAPFCCGPCQLAVNFTGRHLRHVMGELPST